MPWESFYLLLNVGDSRLYPLLADSRLDLLYLYLTRPGYPCPVITVNEWQGNWYEKVAVTL